MRLATIFSVSMIKLTPSFRTARRLWLDSAHGVERPSAYCRMLHEHIDVGAVLSLSHCCGALWRQAKTDENLSMVLVSAHRSRPSVEIRARKRRTERRRRGVIFGVNCRTTCAHRRLSPQQFRAFKNAGRNSQRCGQTVAISALSTQCRRGPAPTPSSKFKRQADVRPKRLLKSQILQGCCPMLSTAAAKQFAPIPLEGAGTQKLPRALAFQERSFLCFGGDLSG